MTGLCIAILATGVAHVLPTRSLTLAWTHSVEGTRWEEDYEVRGSALAIAEARIRGSGAGMEPGSGAIFTGGWWRYAPALPTIAEVALANSAFVAGYTVCRPGAGCLPLDRIVPGRNPVTLAVRPCSEARARE